MSKKKIILDYWCWAWGFMIDMAKRWHTVVWIDTSNEMLSLANKNISNLKEDFRKNIIQTIVWDDEVLLENSKLTWAFDLVSSIMAFQFITNEDIESTIHNLDVWLKKDGVLVFAVRNKAWIEEWIDWYSRFKHQSSLDDWTVNCAIDLNWTWIDSYNRTSSVYDTIVEWLWYEKLHQANPPFTEEFIKKYNREDPYINSEYLILAYKKT